VSFAASLLAAVSMPIFGSIVDHSALRKDIGVMSILVLVACAFLQIMLSARTYIAVAALQLVSLFMALVHAVVYSAYLPEISLSQEDLVKHRTYGNCVFVTSYFIDDNISS
jgi:MFS-type transporter involved in bile tolerance (Atg22 family)